MAERLCMDSDEGIAHAVDSLLVSSSCLEIAMLVPRIEIFIIPKSSSPNNALAPVTYPVFWQFHS